MDECQFCKALFSNNKILRTHQKTAKYCLKIQKELDEKEILCEYCSGCFMGRHNLNSHYYNCREKIILEKDKQIKELLNEKDKQIKELLAEKDKQTKELLAEKDRQLEKLQNIISGIAMNPKTVTHTTNNIVVSNRLNLNDTDRIQNVLENHLDGNVLCNGQKGLARMIYEKLLTGEDGKSIYKCVDPSRHNFEYVNEEGKVERDVKASKLTNALIKGDVCKKAIDVGTDLWKKDDGTTDDMRYQAFSDKVLEVANITKDDSKFRSELSALTS